MDVFRQPFYQFISQYAYEPYHIYIGVFVMMLASGFGFPVPEEVYIVSVGLLAYMGAHPDLFPPPYPNAPVVNGIEAAAVTFLAVWAADCLVFSIGRIFGRKIIRHPRFSAMFPDALVEKIQEWVRKYGSSAAVIFRFTPGIRFPAHILLGAMNFSAARFIMLDGMVALISVPSQILLIYVFGQPILKAIHELKLWILIFFIVAGITYWWRLWLRKRKKSRSSVIRE